MTHEQAAEILQVSLHAPAAERDTKFDELRRQLEDKLAKAPTPGLRDKYRASLKELEEAHALLASAGEAAALPALTRPESTGDSRAPGTPAAPPTVAGPTPGPANRATPARRRSGALEFILVAMVAVGLLGGGGWWIMKTRAENAEKARLAAIAAAEAKALADATAKAAAQQAEALAAARRLAQQAATALEKGNLTGAEEWVRAAQEYVPDLPEAGVVRRQLDKLQAEATTAELSRRIGDRIAAADLAAASRAARELIDHAPADERTVASVTSLGRAMGQAVVAAIDQRNRPAAEKGLRLLGDLAHIASYVEIPGSLHARVNALPQHIRASPKDNLHSILASAPDGAVIELADGVYRVRGLSARQKAVEITGPSDPSRVILEQADQYANSGVIAVFETRVRLANLTLRQPGKFDGESRHAVVAGFKAELDLDNVVIEGAIGNAVWIHHETRLRMNRSRITGSDWAGVFADAGTEATFTDCTIENGKQAGLFARGAVKVGATRTRFLGNGQRGVHIEEGNGARVELNNCEAVGNASTGFEILGQAEVTLSDCVASRNRSSGIRLWGQPIQARVNGLVAEDNASHGLEFTTTADTTAARVQARNNGTEAVYFRGFSDKPKPLFSLRSSTVENNRSSGVWVEFARFSESGNTVRGNQRYNYMTPDKKI